jgi:hypothetical protein
MIYHLSILHLFPYLKRGVRSTLSAALGGGRFLHEHSIGTWSGRPFGASSAVFASGLGVYTWVVPVSSERISNLFHFLVSRAR